jgi:photosystem II stability/assembly factor-like uncharacterized protein
VLRPPVTSAKLHSIVFVTARSGWAVGSHGTVLHTEDGGGTWKPQVSGTSDDLYSVSFPTPQSGWAVGQDFAILHTEDGGGTWKLQSNGVKGLNLVSVTFATPQSGWVAGGSVILHTEDGGHTWKMQSYRGESLNSLAFATPRSGWAVGDESKILHTEDGGGTWKPQQDKSDLSSVSLYDVAFTTPQSGWILVEGGNILHTEDGGSSWKNQYHADNNLFLHSIAFATPLAGWAVGDHGTIVHTEDGGGTWKPQVSGTSVDLYSVTFATPQSVWTVGDGGTILHSEDGGSTWKSQASDIELHSVVFITPQVGWATGSGGTILHTEDGGGTWRPKASNTNQPLLSVAFATPQLGWALGGGATILHTEDGGQTWKQQSSGSDVTLNAVAFATPQLGWAVGDEADTLRTEDGGRNWGRQRLGGGFLGLAFATPQSGWLVGRVGTIQHTEDGGRTWKQQNSGTSEWLYSVAFATPQSGWAVGSGGTMLHTEDGGGAWKQQNSGTGEWLYSVAFATPQSGWAVGSSGTILHTEDGGGSWKTQISGTSFDLYSISFTRPQSGWAVGSGGTILHTEDGFSWSHEGYRRWPAPWFFLALTACVTGLLWASLPLVPPGAEPYIEDLANADSPVAQLKYDALGYKALVMRLLRFIQNPKTKPPLVLAIQAAWGMGKSSVMSMLQTELEEKRAAVTVWFNAWHHQKEDQLLAYLLEAIQNQVAPSWFSPVGLGFRFNLLRVRMFSSPERFLATVAALALLVFHSAVASSLAKVAPISDFLKLHTDWRVGGIAGLLLIPILIIVNQFRAFSSDPQKLLKDSSRSLWQFLRDLLVFPSLQGKTDVRQDFAKNLKEVTDALLPQRLVIFLDDLDRCPPEQVVQILEAINFLSSAAPCFIILGADYRKVETLAGQHFEAIAVQEAENIAPDRSTDVAGQATPATARLEYARNYMRKIVNMRLDLPHPTPKGYVNLIRQVGETGSNLRTRWEQAAIGLLLLLTIVSSIALSISWLNPPLGQPEEGQVMTSQPALPTESVKGTGGLAKMQTGNQSASTTAKIEKPTTVGDTDRDGVGVLWNHRLTIFIPVLIALLFLVRILRRPKEIEKAVDSKLFLDALDKMAPAIQQRCGTPREVRRFQNYLRFLAAWDDSAERPKNPYLEANLVDLAATGTKTNQGIMRTDLDGQVIEFFSKQCDMLGLDPNTFRPRGGG